MKEFFKASIEFISLLLDDICKFMSHTWLLVLFILFFILLSSGIKCTISIVSN